MKNVLLIAICFCIVTSNGLHANWGGGAFGSMASGSLEAIGGESPVALLDEKLDIYLYKGYARVKVKYLFHNTGGDVTVKGGFPCLVLKDYEDKDIVEIENYSISSRNEKIDSHFVMGNEITWLKAPLINEDRGLPRIAWFVSSVFFKAGERKEIDVDYFSNFLGEFGSLSGMQDDYYNEKFRYILSTGSTWKGPIGRGMVRIIPIAADITKVKVKDRDRFKLKNGALTWEFSNLEPSGKDNIEIDYLVNNNVLSEMDPDPDFSKTYVCTHHPQKKYYLINGLDRASAKSSSSLKGIYDAGNAIDGKHDTAWIEGKEGDGRGEWLDISLKREISANEIGIVPGYAKTREIYYRNNRISKLEIILNGERSIMATIPDDQYTHSYHPERYHYIDVSGYAKKVKNIKLIIRGVYRGADNDTCIGDVVVRKRLSKRPAINGPRGSGPWQP
ncbi:MAG: hypothetical protein KBA61_08415 [Spirochaetes bacterium]|nr:hypothetical protein [Spirochaetota bacterium]